MTRSELVIFVADRLPYLTQKDAEIIVDTIFDSMVECLAQGDRIEIRGFGSFAVKHRACPRGKESEDGRDRSYSGKAAAPLQDRQGAIWANQSDSA